MTMLTTWFLMHAYDLNLSLHLCLSMHATWLSPHHSLMSSDSPGYVYLDPGASSLWILPVADQSGAVKAWISGRPSRVLFLPGPLSRLSSIPFVTRERILYYSLLYILYILALCLSVM